MADTIQDLNKRRGELIKESTARQKAITETFRKDREAVKAEATEELAKLKTGLSEKAAEINTECTKACNEIRRKANEQLDAIRNQHVYAQADILDKSQTDTEDLAEQYERDLEAERMRLEEEVVEIDQRIAEAREPK